MLFDFDEGDIQPSVTSVGTTPSTARQNHNMASIPLSITNLSTAKPGLREGTKGHEISEMLISNQIMPVNSTARLDAISPRAFSSCSTKPRRVVDPAPLQFQYQSNIVAGAPIELDSSSQMSRQQSTSGYSAMTRTGSNFTCLPPLVQGDTSTMTDPRFSEDMSFLLQGTGVHSERPWVAGVAQDTSTTHKRPRKMVSEHQKGVNLNDSTRVDVNHGEVKRRKQTAGASTWSSTTDVSAYSGVSRPSQGTLVSHPLIAPTQVAPTLLSTSASDSRARLIGLYNKEDSGTKNTRVPVTSSPSRQSRIPYYQRQRRNRVFCSHCSVFPEGFRGEHERRRHYDRAHKSTRIVWVTVDKSPNKDFFGNCKPCREGKRYGADYNAAAHLRRHHFCKETKGGMPRSDRLAKKTANIEMVKGKLEGWGIQWWFDDVESGGRGSKRDPEGFSLRFLRTWLQEIEVVDEEDPLPSYSNHAEEVGGQKLQDSLKGIISAAATHSLTPSSKHITIGGLPSNSPTRALPDAMSLFELGFYQSPDPDSDQQPSALSFDARIPSTLEYQSSLHQAHFDAPALNSEHSPMSAVTGSSIFHPGGG